MRPISRHRARKGLLKPDRRRALELLAASRDGCTEAIMLGHGFRDQSGRWLRGLQIGCRLLASLGHDVVADLLAFHKAAHAGALHRADVHEHVLAAVARLDESKAFLSIEELHGTCGHHGLLALQYVCVSAHASIAWPVIQFWGSWLGTLKRGASRGRPKTGCGLLSM